MKNQIAILALIAVVASNAFAMPIPKEKLASYQEAVKLALDEKPLECSMAPGFGWANGTLGDTIKNTTSGVLDSNGAQPLLIFSYNDGSTKFDYQVTTSSDYKLVLSVTFRQETSTKGKINIGDLDNPKIIDQEKWDLVLTANCQ